MKSTSLLLTILLMILHSSVIYAYSAKTEQAKLDKACESARQKALAPQKKRNLPRMSHYVQKEEISMQT